MKFPLWWGRGYFLELHIAGLFCRNHIDLLSSSDQPTKTIKYYKWSVL